MKIVVDTTSRILYASFYLQGLFEIAGKKNVTFAAEPFADLDRRGEQFAFEHYFAFITIERGVTTKYVIDFCDPPDISPIAYQWCDVYGKMNFNRAETSEEFLEKIVALPPGFGIRIWNFWQTGFLAVSNFLKCGTRRLKPWKAHFRDYLDQYRRLTVQEYKSFRGKARRGYVFHASTLWHGEEQTSRNRKLFLDQAKLSGCKVEGGFYAPKNHPERREYLDWIQDKSYPMRQWAENTARSCLVFSTPAVHGCYGWKLAEYLAMGKAIVSTPFIAPPVPLEHGVHIHIAEDEETLAEAIKMIAADIGYRKKLEAGAAAYFDETAAPKKVMEGLLASGNRNQGK